MNDPFTTRVRAAAVAGWWTVLIALAFAIFLTIAYLLLMSHRPPWMLTIWGPDITWSEIQHLFLWLILAFRFVVWLLVLIVVWLTLWARQLRKRTGTA